ncbi:hypothetical protein Tco_1031779 [Tanacetum coccineum]|uniref:Uncharacterized protein n=1 Tax=Tanacetum coccineum TaxID=301880 RepID=A0ABQ5G9Z5_9ASTR
MSNTNMQTQTSSVLHNDTVSSCATSKVQEKTQLSRSRCMNSLREVKSQFKFLTETLQDFGTMSIFKRTFSQDLDLLEQHLTKEIISQTDCKTILTKLRTTFENAFNSEFKEQDSNSKTASSKSVKESSLDSATKDVHAIKYKMSKAKERCMAYFRSLHSHLQDNVPQCRSTKKQLDKDEFQEDESMAAFWMVNNQFQKFIDSQFSLDYDSQMSDKHFVKCTGIKYDRKVNKRQMQTQESKIDMGKAIDANLVNTESIRTDSIVQDESSRSVHDTDADDANIRPIYDEEPMVEVQLTAECNIFAIGQQHTNQPKIINEGGVDQYPEQCQVKSPMLD